MDSKLSHELIADALHKALLKRRPEAGIMFHSDRGTQYASYAFRDLIEQHGFCSEHEFIRKLLRQRSYGIVFSHIKDGTHLF